MRPGVDAAAAAGLPTVLLTNNEANLPFYEVAGFRRGPRGTHAEERPEGLGYGQATVTEPLAQALARPGRDRGRALGGGRARGRGRRREQTRRLAGRVLARRDMGKLVFLDLVDRSGRIQLLCPAARTGEVDVHLGDIVGAIGKPTKSRRGEPSLIVDRLELLARIRSPLPGHVPRAHRRRAALPAPVPRPADERGDRADFILRSRMIRAIRHFLDGDGFVEVETPVLQADYGGAFAGRSSPTTTCSTRISSCASPAASST